MDEKTLTALKGSIEKWRAIVEDDGEERGVTNCPLCKLFHPTYHGRRLRDDMCPGCPVSETTGNGLCQGTPYEEWAEITDDYGDPQISSLSEKDQERALGAAKAELAFLRGLLPPEAPNAD